MKSAFLSWILAGAVLAASPQLRADDASTISHAASGPQGQRMEKAREAFEQLDLTDAQKAQIKQIRANTQPGKERRQQVMAVLTPEQKAKLIEMLKERRDGDR